MSLLRAFTIWFHALWFFSDLVLKSHHIAVSCCNTLNPKHHFTCAIPLVANKSHEKKANGTSHMKGAYTEGALYC